MKKISRWLAMLICAALLLPQAAPAVRAAREGSSAVPASSSGVSANDRGPTTATGRPLDGRGTVHIRDEEDLQKIADDPYGSYVLDNDINLLGVWHTIDGRGARSRRRLRAYRSA